MAFTRHTKEEALEQVKTLVEAFGKNLKNYKTEEYLEANCKSEFIEKLLLALNWDVNNENGVAPRYKEVVMEARANEKGTIKHPDYGLCIGGRHVFYVEAKPPSVKILNADEGAMQLRHYAYHMSKPVSILTDFEEMAVYDTRKPVKSEDESAERCRVKYIGFEDYMKEFDYLWDTFSYDAVIRGSIDTYFDKTNGNYYKNDIDGEMLDAIEEWRHLLVKSIRAKSGNITEQNINMAVQRLINRIVYIWRSKGY